MLSVPLRPSGSTFATMRIPIKKNYFFLELVILENASIWYTHK